MRTKKHRIRESAIRFVRYGVTIATVYVGFVLVMSLLGGNQLAVLGGSWPRVLVAYYGVGVLAGAIVGALWPVAETRFSRLVVSVVAAAPSVFFFLHAVRPDDSIHHKLLASFIMSVVVGPGYLWALRED